MLIKESKLRYELHINYEELTSIKNFIQGAVYCWIKNRKDEIFAARDLFGGDNYDWNGTPLIALYNKHINQGKNENSAVDEAGKDVGWILKLVLYEDQRLFDTCDAGMARGYKWLPR